MEVEDKICCAELGDFIEYLNSLSDGEGEVVISGKEEKKNKFKICPFCGSDLKDKTPLLDTNKKYEITWDPKLDTGIPWIDNQHKKLLERLNILLNSIIHKDGSNEAGSAITFLRNYVNAHFGTEESIMQRNNYPGYAKQKKQHEIFVKRLDGFVAEHGQSGSSNDLVLKLSRELWNWFKDHISKEDKKFGVFLKGTKSAPGESADEMYNTLIENMEE